MCKNNWIKIVGFFVLFVVIALGNIARGQTPTPTPCPERTFNFINNCGETIWLAAVGLSPGGWELDMQPSQGCNNDSDCPTGQTCDTNTNQCQFSLCVPNSFSGRFWPRTGCNFNSTGECLNSNKQSFNCCDTGGCTISGGGWGLQCTSSGQAPNTVAEFTLNSSSSSSTDFYDVSVIDGFNVAVEVAPVVPSPTPQCPTGFNDCDYWCGNPGGTTSTTGLNGCTWDTVLDSTCDNNTALRVVNTGLCALNGDCTTCTSDSDCTSPEICGVGNNEILGNLVCGTFVGCTTPKALCGTYFPKGTGGAACSHLSDCASSTCLSTDPATKCPNGPPDCAGVNGATCRLEVCVCEGGACTGTCPASPVDSFDCNTIYSGTVSCTSDTDCPFLIGTTCSNSNDCPSGFNCNVPPTPRPPATPIPGACQEPCVMGSCQGAPCTSNSDCPSGTFLLCDTTEGSQTFDTCVATNTSLFEATGTGQSCYSTNTTDLCAGCPTDSSNILSSFWPTPPSSFSCNGNNLNWAMNIQPWLAPFKEACPTAYSFPFDDPTSTFQCNSGGTTNNVGYTVTFSFCPGTDSERDGVIDALDLDQENDGIPNVPEDSGGGNALSAKDAVDINGDGIPVVRQVVSLDADGDGIPNRRDLDSDEDGKSDIIEAGGSDANGDGMIDNFTDSDGDGLADSVDPDQGGRPLPVPDSDGDGIPNFLDPSDTSGSSGCSIVSAGATLSIPLFLLIPVFILIRRAWRRYMS